MAAAGSTAKTPKHFRSPAAFRRWLGANHATADELWLGFWNKKSGRGGLTYPEAVDELLCFGWIDGVKKKVDDERYTNRITPRKPRSKWSDANLRRYGELDAEGRIAEPGRAARARFDPSKHTPYSFEGKATELSPDLRAEFQAHAEAWRSFRDQPPGYRRTAIHWVMSAKRAATRERRLRQLVEVSSRGGRLPQISGRRARPSRP